MQFVPSFGRWYVVKTTSGIDVADVFDLSCRGCFQVVG